MNETKTIPAELIGGPIDGTTCDVAETIIVLVLNERYVYERVTFNATDGTEFIRYRFAGYA